MPDSSAELVVLSVVVFVVLAVAIGLVLFARSSRTYDEIGGGIFDRPRGDHEERYPPDAEGEEFMGALAEFSEREEDPSEDPSADAEEGARRQRAPSRRAARMRRRSRGRG